MNKVSMVLVAAALLVASCAGLTEEQLETAIRDTGVAQGSVTTDTLNKNLSQAIAETAQCRREVDRLADEVADLALSCPPPRVGVTIAPELFEAYCATPSSGYRPLDCSFKGDGLRALKLYGPSAWEDGYDSLDFGCPGSPVTAPATLDVLRGCAGNHTATVDMRVDGFGPCTLKYKGQGQTSHCTGPSDTTTRNVYAFESNTCDFAPGEVVNATILSVRVDNGANKPAADFPVTQVFADFEVK